ncbi:hypothetical protein GGX14DRAFT_396772 [Mycena pura]|uniref:Uncharacterized protein n=1 Tax=Mycena pura TaxID=153505 RepID=A0AAD6VA87_9AGAR|nr:hypothetical protein GGX14DRAFT_396772 [Mycena pura]
MPRGAALNVKINLTAVHLQFAMLKSVKKCQSTRAIREAQVVVECTRDIKARGMMRTARAQMQRLRRKSFFFDRDIDPNSAALRDLLALESEEPEPEMSQKEKHKSMEVKKTTTAELDWSQIRRGGSKS